MLCTTARAKQTAALANVSTTLLENLLNAANGAIEEYCGRTFDSTSYTESVDGNGTDKAFINNPPIITLTQVVITEIDGTTETIAASNFDTNANAGVVAFGASNASGYSAFPSGFQNVRVDYTGGFTTVPAAVQEACVQVALRLYAQSSSYKNPAFSAEKMGEHQYTKIAATDPIFTPLVEALLAKYRRMTF